MKNIDQRIADLLPAHYREYAPRFITFLEKYYEWLHRTSGLTEEEMDWLRNDTSWLQKDIDQFIKTGQLRYFDDTAAPNRLEDAISVLDHTVAPGAESDNLIDNFLMEGKFNGYTPYSPEQVVGTADTAVEMPTIENKILDGWFDSMGFDRIKRGKLRSVQNIDQVLMISLLKHIYAIKGTEASISLFFNLMFEEEVQISQPKLKIAVLDDSFKLDCPDVLRDDEEYQEFSYVILVPGPVSKYLDVFNTMYLKTIHPAGFRVELRQYTLDVADGLILEDGSGYLMVEPGVFLDIYE